MQAVLPAAQAESIHTRINSCFFARRAATSLPEGNAVTDFYPGGNDFSARWARRDGFLSRRDYSH
jgi:hypothetical protein